MNFQGDEESSSADAIAHAIIKVASMERKVLLKYSINVELTLQHSNVRAYTCVVVYSYLVFGEKYERFILLEHFQV